MYRPTASLFGIHVSFWLFDFFSFEYITPHYNKADYLETFTTCLPLTSQTLSKIKKICKFLSLVIGIQNKPPYDSEYSKVEVMNPS